MTGQGQYRATVSIRAVGAFRPAMLRCCDAAVHTSAEVAGRCGARQLRRALAPATRPRRNAMLAPMQAAYTVERYVGTTGWVAVTW